MKSLHRQRPAPAQSVLDGQPDIGPERVRVPGLLTLHRSREGDWRAQHWQLPDRRGTHLSDGRRRRRAARSQPDHLRLERRDHPLQVVDPVQGLVEDVAFPRHARGGPGVVAQLRAGHLDPGLLQQLQAQLLQAALQPLGQVRRLYDRLVSLFTPPLGQRSRDVAEGLAVELLPHCPDRDPLLASVLACRPRPYPGRRLPNLFLVTMPAIPARCRDHARQR